jgi:hypothetical protein
MMVPDRHARLLLQLVCKTRADFLLSAYPIVGDLQSSQSKGNSQLPTSVYGDFLNEISVGYMIWVCRERLGCSWALSAPGGEVRVNFLPGQTQRLELRTSVAALLAPCLFSL